jgi:uncharacterized membrane protein YuzA (DUF378 family)
MKKSRKTPWWLKTLVAVALLSIGIYSFNHIAAWLGFFIVTMVIAYVLIITFNKFKDYVDED